MARQQPSSGEEEEGRRRSPWGSSVPGRMFRKLMHRVEKADELPFEFEFISIEVTQPVSPMHTELPRFPEAGIPCGLPLLSHGGVDCRAVLAVSVASHPRRYEDGG